MAAIAVTIDASSFARAAGLLEQEPARIARDLLTLTQRRAKLAKEALARATPVAQPQPGAAPHAHMRDLWHQESTGPSASVVFNEAAYSMFLFTGTAAHQIEPRDARALHFYAGGTEVWTQHALHPGTAPDPKLLRTLDDQLDKAQGDLFDWGVAEVGRMAREIG